MLRPHSSKMIRTPRFLLALAAIVESAERPVTKTDDEAEPLSNPPDAADTTEGGDCDPHP